MSAARVVGLLAIVLFDFRSLFIILLAEELCRGTFRWFSLGPCWQRNLTEEPFTGPRLVPARSPPHVFLSVFFFWQRNLAEDPFMGPRSVPAGRGTRRGTLHGSLLGALQVPPHVFFSELLFLLLLFFLLLFLLNQRHCKPNIVFFRKHNLSYRHYNSNVKCHSEHHVNYSHCNFNIDVTFPC